MKKEFGDDIIWVRGLPDDPYKYFKHKEPGLIIIDDLMSEIEGQSRQVSQWFTKGSHHMNISIALLVQNIFPKNMRTISLNAHILVLFNNPRDQTQLVKLLSQAFPGNPVWVKKALQYIFSVPYRPAVFNFFPSTPKHLSITCDVFPEDLQRSQAPFPQVILPPSL